MDPGSRVKGGVENGPFSTPVVIGLERERWIAARRCGCLPALPVGVPLALTWERGDCGVSGDIPSEGPDARRWSSRDGNPALSLNASRSIESSIELAGRSGTKRHARGRDLYSPQGLRVRADEVARSQGMGGWVSGSGSGGVDSGAEGGAASGSNSEERGLYNKGFRFGDGARGGSVARTGSVVAGRGGGRVAQSNSTESSGCGEMSRDDGARERHGGRVSMAGEARPAVTLGCGRAACHRDSKKGRMCRDTVDRCLQRNQTIRGSKECREGQRSRAVVVDDGASGAPLGVQPERLVRAGASRPDRAVAPGAVGADSGVGARGVRGPALRDRGKATRRSRSLGADRATTTRGVAMSDRRRAGTSEPGRRTGRRQR